MKSKVFFIGCIIIATSACKQITCKNKQNDISPYLFGQNLWLTAGSEGRPGYIDTLWPKIKESGVKIIRIGGNGYDMHMPSIDTLTRWVKSIKEIGAEPLFQVSRIETAEEAAALVKYFNIDNDYKIKFWSIGNEPYQIGHWSIDTISKYIKAYATIMKEVDPTIKIFIPDAAAYYNDLYEALLIDDNKSVAGRDKNGNWYIDGVTFHNYPNSKNYTRADVIFYSVTKMRGMIMNLKSDIETANEKYSRYGDNKLMWALTEFNITYNNPDDHSAEGIAVPSFINGQFWVDIFGLAMEYNAFAVTPWCIQESDRPSTYFGYIGAPPEFIPHSTFYHMQLMSENIKGRYVKMWADNPFIKIHGSKSKKESTIIIMNQDINQTVDFDFNNINKSGKKGLFISSQENLNADYNGSISPNTTLVFVFDSNGKLKKQIIYNLEMAKNNKTPQTIEQ
jgi:hypothetical protein